MEFADRLIIRLLQDIVPSTRSALKPFRTIKKKRKIYEWKDKFAMNGFSKGLYWICMNSRIFDHLGPVANPCKAG